MKVGIVIVLSSGWIDDVCAFESDVDAQEYIRNQIKERFSLAPEEETQITSEKGLVEWLGNQQEGDIKTEIRWFETEVIKGGGCPMKKPKVSFSTTAYVEVPKVVDIMRLDTILGGGWASGQENICTTAEDIQAELDDFDSGGREDDVIEKFLLAVLEEVSGNAGDVIFYR